jgi:ribonuclease P protein component
MPSAGLAGADHVLVGRAGGIERPFVELRTELEKALAKLKRRAVRPELVESPSFSSGQQKTKERASTGSARTDVERG